MGTEPALALAATNTLLRVVAADDSTRIYVPEWRGARTKSNSNQSRNCGSAGQAAPLEAIAKQLAVKQKMAESWGDLSNSELSELFDTLAQWESVLQAQNIDFSQLSPPEPDATPPEEPQP